MVHGLFQLLTITCLILVLICATSFGGGPPCPPPRLSSKYPLSVLLLCASMEATSNFWAENATLVAVR